MTDPVTMSDDELDAVTAVEVMEWVFYEAHAASMQPACYLDGEGAHVMDAEDWSPIADPRDERAVVGRMRKLGGDPFIDFWNQLRLVTLGRVTHDSPIRNHCGDAHVLWYLDGRAICEAAVLARRAAQ